MLERASEFEDEGKPLHAMQAYRRIIAAVPGQEDAYVRLSRLLWEMGRYEEAERLLQRGREENPRNAVFLMKLGELHLRRRHYARAIACYRRLGNRRIPQAHFNLGVAYMHVGDWINAEAEMRAALLLDAKLLNAYIALGEIMIKRKLYREAIADLQKGLEIEPYSGMCHRMLGAAHLSLYEWTKAYDEFVQAVDTDPRDAVAWQLCGEVLLRMRRFEEAEPYLKKALALNPRSADVSASLGYLCLHRGETDKALAAFNEALKLDPAHPRALDGKLHITIQRKKSQ